MYRWQRLDLRRPGWWACFVLAALPVAHGQDDALSEDEAATMLERIIDTDRNSFTFSPLTVDPGRYLSEVSYTYIDVRSALPKHSFPEYLTRVGITEALELRFGWNYETGGSENAAVGDIANFFGADMEQQMLYGAKLAITHQKGLRPASAFFAQGHTPTGGRQANTQARLGYSFGWELPNDWIFDAGFECGTDSVDGDGYFVWAPSAVMKFPFGREKRWFTHLEYFSVFTQNKRDPFNNQFLDTGLHFLVTPDIEIGGIIGMGLNPDAPPLLASFGVGIRF